MQNNLIQSIQKHAIPFEAEADLTPLMNKIGDAKIVLLGESSHGTSEFYKVRAEISKRLIEERGFHAIAVEGDWPSCQQVNTYVKNESKEQNVRNVLHAFKRWPTWMWANDEVEQLVKWLKRYNEKQVKTKKIGFYGIDVYSLWESLEEIMRYLKKTEPNGANLELAKKAIACFEPFNKQENDYAISASFFSEGCVDEVAKLLTAIRMQQQDLSMHQESDLNLKVNAMVAKDAENYYRMMVQNDAESWNIRDRHMVDTLNEVRNFYGEDAKVIVWEHNTHVGDASATDMKAEGMTNVGQVLREQNKKEDVYIVGFGTHSGTVVAADEWGVNLERMIVPEAEVGSWEDAMHQAGPYNKILLFDQVNQALFEDIIGHRAIGVVYNPAYEAYGNYVPSIMSKRYDAFIHIDQTEALHPLNISHVKL